VRKEVLIHLVILFVFFLLISLARSWLKISYWPFWLGGLIGVFLPDVDHLIYIYFLKPHEHSSQRVNYMVGEKNFSQAVNFLADTRSERQTLVFHTILFQIIFLILTFLLITSSGSPFGRGLVLSFSLHFLVDQLLDIRNQKINRWFYQIPFSLEMDKFKVYWSIAIILLLVFGFLL